MTDPKELRAAAKEHREWCHESHHDVPPWVDHILATVRDDDGEEQPDVAVNRGVDELRVADGGVWWLKYSRKKEYCSCVQLLDYRPTRGQFRDLCRGLGIDTTP